jgi:hypothetical protein
MRTVRNGFCGVVIELKPKNALALAVKSEVCMALRLFSRFRE